MVLMRRTFYRWRSVTEVSVAQPLHPTNLVHFNNDEQPTPLRYTFDTHTEGSNGIYGLTRDACWAHDRILPRLAGSVKESHIHLPEPNVIVFILLLSVSVYLLM